MEYQNCLSSLFRLHRFGIKLELDTVRSMLDAIGNPQNKFNSIHIAGTNGKGSVAAMLSHILAEAGYSVGRYTSPHLESFNERIAIDNRPIDNDDVVEAWRQVSAVAPPRRQPTFFEFTTVMAFAEFARKRVQWAIIETGMGGRMDATNVISPRLSVITNISLEHREYLGATISAIAHEKAGIIKPGVPAVTGIRQPTAWAAVCRQADSCRAPVFRQGTHFRQRRRSSGLFSYYGMEQVLSDLHVNLEGDYQVDNAGLVLACCELLNKNREADLDEAAIRRGLAQVRWPGRLEVVSQSPKVILDGAHNRDAARVLARHLANRYADRKITLVVGILSDKPVEYMLGQILPLCHRIIVTQPRLDRAIPADSLAEAARRYSSRVEVQPNVGDALQMALSSAADNDVVCVAGSLYVVGEAKTALRVMGIGQAASGS